MRAYGQISHRRSPFKDFKRGITYGGLTLGFAFLTGAISGLFRWYSIQPAVAFASSTGVIVLLNLFVALFLILRWSLVYLLSRKPYLIPKFFLISLGYCTVYMLFFGVLRIGNFYYF